MRIRGWQVEGFGVLCDYDVTDLPDGLVLVHGPNEAGKSTLLAFLRGVLFGFPDRRGSEPLYPPLRGGRHGGALMVEGPNGIYRVERLGGRRGPLAIVRPDDTEGGENDLQQLLGGADRQLFRSVFAFSLQELNSMETLSSDQVRARIFSAGIAGAGRSAREVIDDLHEEAGLLLGARSGRIRELVREAQSLSDQVGAAVRRASEYTEALRREEDAGVEVGRLRDELTRAETSARRANTLIDSWPTESERQASIRVLGALPEIDSFPANPEERLTEALGGVRTAGGSFDETDQELQRLLDHRRDIDVDDRLPPISTAVGGLVAQCAVHREHLARIGDVSSELRQHDDGIGQVLRELGPGWDEPRLASFDTSLPAAEEVRGWQQRLERATREAESAASALALFDRQVAGIDEALARIGAELDRREGSPAEDWFRAVSARLTAVAEAIATLEARAPELVFDARPVETAAAALTAARQGWARLRAIADDAGARARAIMVSPELAALQEPVTEAARHVEVERQRLRDIESQEATRRERQEAVERGTRDLGAGWDEAHVGGMACDFAQIRQAREFAARLADDRERLTGAQRELDHVGKGRSAREKDLQRLQQELASPEPASLEALERQNRSLRRLRTRLAELAEIEGARRAEERVKADAAREDAPTEPDARWLGWAPGAAGAIAIVVALLATWRLLVQDATRGASLAFVAALTALLAFALRFAASRARPAAGGVLGQQRRKQEVGRRLADIEKRAADIRGPVAEDARTLGLPDLPTLEQVEDRQEEMSGERDARRRRDDQVAAASLLTQELESWRESELRRRTEHDDAAEQAAETVRQWEAWLAAKDLPAGMTPDAARDFLQQVRSLQARIEERNAIGERLRTQRTAWQAWRTNAEALLAAGGDSTASASEAATLFERILDVQRRCAEQATRARERKSAQHEAEDWDEKLARAQRARDTAEGDAMSAVRDAHERVADRWRSARAARDSERGRLETFDRESERAAREWDAWQASHGLDRRMSPEGVLDFFDLLRRGHDAIGRRNQMKGTLDTLRAGVAAWEQRVEDVVSTAGLRAPEGAPDAWIDAVGELDRRCQADAAARREAGRLDEAIADGDCALGRARDQRERCEETLAALFLEAGVSSEAEFRERLAQYRSREDLERKVAELESRIVAFLGRGDEAADVRSELSTGRISEWTAQRSERSAEVLDLRTRHEDAIRGHQDLSNERRQLEEAADVADIELQYQAVLEELDAAVRRRRVVSLAATLVGETLREFERTRQPRVLANASEAFARVTDGRYPKVVQTEDAEGIVVLDRLGARRTVAELSRGTQEQLYLSMRLGLAREFGERAVPLPLVMDDVLVNFDESRARHMARELMAFATDHQVLLFTCHSFVRSMLLDLDPDVRVIDMPVYDVAGQDSRLGESETDTGAERPSSLAGPALEASVLQALASSGPLSLTELAGRLECDPEQVRRVLSGLRDRRQVNMSGQKRGARYALGDVDGA
jgi:uncharacterized protein YhaN